jgi:hypothetical protein
MRASKTYGNAIARGDINLKQTLAQLGIDDNEPSLSAEEKTATVRGLLEAALGSIMRRCTRRRGTGGQGASEVAACPVPFRRHDLLAGQPARRQREEQRSVAD